MFFQIKAYLRFLWHSKNEHGVHSPFVFDLVTQCFYDKADYPQYATLKQYRKTLLQRNETIQVTDFGAGSRVFKSNTRKISAIAQHAGISSKRAALLFRIVRYFQPSNMLEIGTSLGLASSALSLGNPKAQITTLEGCPNTMAVAENQFERFRLSNIYPVVTAFESYLQTENQKPTTRNLIYFDGNHSEEATLDYFERLLATIANDSVWIFDDIHWSPGMEAAWERIKKHPKVTVTVDTFQWGLVFFRKEQQKEHFTIRI